MAAPCRCRRSLRASRPGRTMSTRRATGGCTRRSSSACCRSSLRASRSRSPRERSISGRTSAAMTSASRATSTPARMSRCCRAVILRAQGARRQSRRRPGAHLAGAAAAAVHRGRRAHPRIRATESIMNDDLKNLQSAIDAAFELRAEITPKNIPAGAARACWRNASRCSIAGSARVAEHAGRQLGRQRVAEEGGAALLPHPRQRGDGCGLHALLRQGAAEICRRDRGGAARRRRARGAARDRAQGRLHRTQRGADAQLRQHRRLRRRRAPWSTPGRRSAPARRSAATCIFPAAWASAACSSRCRRARPSSRTTASSARARRSSKASSSRPAR